MVSFLKRGLGLKISLGGKTLLKLSLSVPLRYDVFLEISV